MTTKIIECTCKNDWSDQKYGTNKRVANKKAGEKKEFRCATCMREHSFGNDDTSKKPKK